MEEKHATKDSAAKNSLCSVFQRWEWRHNKIKINVAKQCRVPIHWHQHGQVPSKSSSVRGHHSAALWTIGLNIQARKHPYLDSYWDINPHESDVPNSVTRSNRRTLEWSIIGRLLFGVYPMTFYTFLCVLFRCGHGGSSGLCRNQLLEGHSTIKPYTVCNKLVDCLLTVGPAISLCLEC